VTEFLLELGFKYQTVSVLIKVIITLVLIIICYLLKKSICSFIDRSNLDSKDILKYKKNASISLNILSAVVIIPIWMYDSKDILTFLGIFSAGLAFAFRDVIASFFGWLIINTKKPFQIGDRIKIGKALGDVLAVNWFYTTIVEVTEDDNKTHGQSTGRITYIPNIKVLSEELINETNSFPFTWNEIEINLSIKSNWKKAKNILINIANAKVGYLEEEAKDSLNIASKTLPIYYENLSPTVYTSIETGRVSLNLRFICKARNFRNLQHVLVEDILDEFDKHEDIELL
jgi:small-conductance mechanosensitive channel